MTVRSFTVSAFQENCYVLHDGGEAALVDPGTETREERQRVSDYIERHGLAVRHLLLTHGHLDHVFGCSHFAHRYGADAETGGWALHPADRALYDHTPIQGQLYGVRVDAPPPPTRELHAGDTILLGGSTLRVLHAPGHSPGSVCFYDAEGGTVIGGDVLFRGSIGRTDLMGGDFDALIASIRSELLTLPGETVVYPGHGPATTVAEEARSNPFLTGEIRA